MRVSDNDIIKLTKKATSKYRTLAEGLFGSYEDMLSHMFMRVYTFIGNYDPEKSQLSTYIYRIVKTGIMLKIREAKSNRSKVNYEHLSIDTPINSEEGELKISDIVSDGKDPLENYERSNIIRIVEPYMDDMSRLYFIEDLNQKEIAERLKTTQSNVSRKIKQFANKMRMLLEEDVVPNKRGKTQERINAIMKARKCSQRTAFRILSEERKSYANKRREIERNKRDDEQ